jgi:hypothetical protein
LIYESKIIIGDEAAKEAAARGIGQDKNITSLLVLSCPKDSEPAIQREKSSGSIGMKHTAN